MSDNAWILLCETILKQMKANQNLKSDRLDFTRSIRFTLGALERSLVGWLQWVNNPDILSQFNKQELEEMNKSIINFVEFFIKYDMKITTEGIQKYTKEINKSTSIDNVFYT